MKEIFLVPKLMLFFALSVIDSDLKKKPPFVCYNLIFFGQLEKQIAIVG